jgi:hypothetical protein
MGIGGLFAAEAEQLFSRPSFLPSLLACFACFFFRPASCESGNWELVRRYEVHLPGTGGEGAPILPAYLPTYLLT